MATWIKDKLKSDRFHRYFTKLASILKMHENYRLINCSEKLEKDSLGQIQF